VPKVRRPEVAAQSRIYAGGDVLKTPLEKGRAFTKADASSSQQVAVINEALQYTVRGRKAKNENSG